MQIDWLTVAAQVVNFLVLVGLLGYFLYHPVVRVMAEREASIAARLNEAEQARKEADHLATEYREKTRQLDREREELRAQIRAEAEELRARLTREVKEGVEKLRAGWLDAVRRERHVALHDLRQQIGERVVAVVRRVLTDLADADLQRQVVAGFLRRLERLTSEERDELREALESERDIRVRTTHSLTGDEQERVTAAVHDHLSDRVGVGFETDPDLVCGIELRAGSHALGWSVGSYLDDLEAALDRLVEERVTTREDGDAGAADDSRD